MELSEQSISQFIAQLLRNNHLAVAFSTFRATIARKNVLDKAAEDAIIQLLGDQGYPYLGGSDIERDPSDVLIRSDLRELLTKRYAGDNITTGEIDSIIRKLDALNAADLYDWNKTVCK